MTPRTAVALAVSLIGAGQLAAWLLVPELRSHHVALLVLAALHFTAAVLVLRQKF